MDGTSTSRFRRLVTKPLSTPFLPLFGITALAATYIHSRVGWLLFILVTGLLYVLGDELERRRD